MELDGEVRIRATGRDPGKRIAVRDVILNHVDVLPEHRKLALLMCTKEMNDLFRLGIAAGIFAGLFNVFFAKGWSTILSLISAGRSANELASLNDTQITMLERCARYKDTWVWAFELTMREKWNGYGKYRDDIARFTVGRKNGQYQAEGLSCFPVRRRHGVTPVEACQLVHLEPVVDLSAPRNVRVTPGDRSLTVSWEPPARTAGLLEYRVSYFCGPPTVWVEWPPDHFLNADERTSTITGLNNGRACDVKVSARSGGANPQTVSSPSVRGTPQRAATPPGAPRNLTVTPGDRSLSVSWSPPASDGGSPITGYTVNWGGPSAGEITTVGTSYTITPLTNGEYYSVSVRAKNRRGSGDRVSSGGTPRRAATPPGAPRNLTVTPGDRSLSLSWSPPASDGGSPITSYTVNWGGPSAGEITTVGTSYTITPLTNGEYYSVSVRAKNRRGSGDRVSSGGTPRRAATPPGAPRNLTVTPGDRSLSLSWSPPASDGGSPITSYTIAYSESGGRNSGTITVRSTSYTLEDRTNGIAYSVSVAANNRHGRGDYTAPASATPQAPATAPGAPRDLSVTPGDRSLSVSWSPPASDGGSPITGYYVSYWDESRGQGGGRTVGGTSAIFTGLDNGTTYTVGVTAINRHGEGNRATTSATPLAPESVPGPPRNLQVTPGNGTFTVSWSAPSDDGGSPITGYDVGYWGCSTDDTASDVETVSATTYTHTFTGVPRGSTCTVQVDSINRHGTTAGPRTTVTIPAAAVARGVSLAVGGGARGGGHCASVHCK